MHGKSKISYIIKISDYLIEYDPNEHGIEFNKINKIEPALLSFNFAIFL